MLESLSPEKKKLILQKITKSLARHSSNTDLYKLIEILKERKQKIISQNSPKKDEEKEIISKIKKENEKQNKELKKLKEKLKQEEIEIKKLKKENQEKIKKDIKKTSKKKIKINKTEPKFDFSALIPQERKIRKSPSQKPPKISEKPKTQIKKIEPMIIPPIKKKIFPTNYKRRVLKIPSPALPRRLNYLKPKIENKKIDLEKLNVLLNDKNVKSIECFGENIRLVVNGTMGRKPTTIALTKEEILEIINRFSEATKIPASPGIFKVAFGNLIFTALIQKNETPKFTIEKMTSPAPYRIPQ